MPRLYAPTNRIKFTDIPDKFGMRRDLKAKLSQFHAAVVTYAVNNYRDSRKFRERIVDALNIFTYCLVENEAIDDINIQLLSSHLFEHLPNIDIGTVESKIDLYFLTPDSIVWDIVPELDEEPDVDDDDSQDFAYIRVVPKRSAEETNTASNKSNSSREILNSTESDKPISRPVQNKPLKTFRAQQRALKSDVAFSAREFNRSDLLIGFPKYPRIDGSSPWLTGEDEFGTHYTIYKTLPEIPTRQSEISATTDPYAWTDSEYMNLYPPEVVHVRKPALYERYDGIEYDEDLGCILPIEGFTTDQVRDNIIKYPYLYGFKKFVSNTELDTSSPLFRREEYIRPFFQTIEIDGQLRLIEDVWDTLPESKLIPRNAEFIKEYVIRRYLLERDSGISHTYDIVGGLDPYLVVFMPPSKYAEYGHTDSLSIIKQCVVARVRYKQNRNPILQYNRSVGDCIYSGHCIQYEDCGTACKRYAQISYLLFRNDIGLNNSALNMTDQQTARCKNILDNYQNDIFTVIVANGEHTSKFADHLTYCAICDRWRGDNLNCNVYNLKAPKYLDLMYEMKWVNNGVPSEELSLMLKWIERSKLLIISNLDFINFKDFNSQHLLEVIGKRCNKSDLTTIIISPPVNHLLGDGRIFARLTSEISNRKVGEVH